MSFVKRNITSASVCLLYPLFTLGIIMIASSDSRRIPTKMIEKHFRNSTANMFLQKTRGPSDNTINLHTYQNTQPTRPPGEEQMRVRGTNGNPTGNPHGFTRTQTPILRFWLAYSRVSFSVGGLKSVGCMVMHHLLRTLFGHFVDSCF